MKFKDLRLTLILILFINALLINQQMVFGQTEYNTVHSADGTVIGFTKIGSGSVPLVIVHGALNSGEQWLPVAQALSDNCTCYVMDRWGRGGSGIHPDYSVNREAEDIAAVLEVAGPNAILLGHSSGAIYTLETALKFPPQKLILYEPPINGFHGRFVQEIWDSIRLAAEEERYEDALTIFLTDEVEISNEQLAYIKSTPMWEKMLSLTPNSVQEWAELVRYKPTVKQYRDISVPTLLLTGSKDINHPSFATQDLDELWPPEQAQVRVLNGQGHIANLEAPEMVTKEIIDFILEKK